MWTGTATADNGNTTIVTALHYTYPYLFTDATDILTPKIDAAVMQNAHAFTPAEIDNLLLDLQHQLGKNAKQWHFLKPLLDQDDRRTFADAWIELKEKHTKVALADTVLLVSLIAQTMLGKTLEDVMITNHTKLSQRLASGQPITKHPRQ